MKVSAHAACRASISTENLFVRLVYLDENGIPTNEAVIVVAGVLRVSC